MRRTLLALLSLAMALLGLGGCAPARAVDGDLGNGWQPDHALALAYATRFSVVFYAGEDGAPCRPTGTLSLAACESEQYALITIAGESRFLVVPEGRPVPGGINPDVVVLVRPLTNLYLAASAAMSLFVALDSLPAVRFSSLRAEGWYLPEARSAMESGQILFGGTYSAPDYELILDGDPSLVVENGMIHHTPQVKQKLEALGLPVLVEQSSYESHPLGRTEWIKLFGVLLGKGELAERRFAEQAEHLDELAGRAGTGRTVAYFYISSTGYVVARKSGDYIPKMIQLAGGEYVFSDLGDDKATSTVKLEMERFYATAKDADYIVYNSTIGGDLATLDELVALNPLLKDFKAVRDGNVWCTDRDFYQDMTGLGEMVTDLHRMLTDPEAPDQLTFVHRLREG
jgi:iron complex transport system substrate-binding protein